MNMMRIRGDMVQLQGGTFKPPAGMPRAKFTAEVAPFEVGRNPVSNEQFRLHLAEQANQRYGALLFGPKGGVLEVVRGELPAAVSDQLLEAERRVSRDGEIGIYATKALKLVPTVDMWEQRFAHLEKGGAEYLGERQPAVFVNWFEAVGLADLVDCRLPTDVEWHWATVYDVSDRPIEYVPGGGNKDLTWHWGMLDNGSSTSPSSESDLSTRVYLSGFPNVDKGGLRMRNFIFEWMGSWSVPQLRAGHNGQPIGPDGDFVVRPLRGVSCYEYEHWYFTEYLDSHNHPNDRYLSVGFRLARDVA